MLSFFPRREGLRQSTLRHAARQALQGEPPFQPSELQELLDLAEIDLRPRFPGQSDATIAAAVLAAWAELEAERAQAYVDLDASTPSLLVLVDNAAGVTRRIPVADLVRMLGPRVVG